MKMHRSDFIKRLGIGISALIVAPKVLGEIIDATSEGVNDGVSEGVNKYNPDPIAIGKEDIISQRQQVRFDEPLPLPDYISDAHAKADSELKVGDWYTVKIENDNIRFILELEDNA